MGCPLGTSFSVDIVADRSLELPSNYKAASIVGLSHVSLSHYSLHVSHLYFRWSRRAPSISRGRSVVSCDGASDAVAERTRFGPIHFIVLIVARTRNPSSRLSPKEAKSTVVRESILSRGTRKHLLRLPVSARTKQCLLPVFGPHDLVREVNIFWCTTKYAGHWSRRRQQTIRNLQDTRHTGGRAPLRITNK